MTLATIGDNCIDRYLPPVGIETIGGNALNVAVGLAQHGHPTAYLGAVGDDDEGRAVVAAARAARVDLEHLVVEHGATGVTLVELVNRNERAFVEERYGVSETYRPSPDALAFLAGCRWVHVVGLPDAASLVSQIGPAGRLSYDFSNGDISSLAEIAPYLGIAFFSAADLSRESAIDLARSAVEMGASTAVVTRGRAGSLAWNGSLAERPAEQVEVLDTLGAGDALIAAVIAARVKGSSLGAALDAGGLAAAQVCMHYGAWRAA